MSESLAQIEEQLVKLRLKQNALQGKEFMRVKAPQIRSCIGKTFVYRNNSCGGDEKWDEFRKLLGAEISEGSASLIFEQVALSKGREPHIGIEIGFVSQHNSNACIAGPGWAPCTKAEYTRERQLIEGQIENPTLMRQYLRSK